MSAKRGVGIFAGVAAFVIASMACACSSTGQPAAPEDVAGPDGGSVRLLGGAVTLEFPPGALAADTRITAASCDSTPDGGVPGACVDLGPDGLSFAQPVRLTIGYDPAKVPQGVDEQLLRLHRLLSGVPQLVSGSRLDRSAATVRGSLDHFSQYAAVQATSGDLVHDISQMGQHASTDDAATFDEMKAATLEDLSAMYPAIDSACEQTPQVASKRLYLDALLLMTQAAETFGLDQYARTMGELCAGILEPTFSGIAFEPSAFCSMGWAGGSAPVGEKVAVTATMYGPLYTGAPTAEGIVPLGQVLSGAVMWFVLAPDVTNCLVTSGAGLASTSATIQTVSPGPCYVAAVSADLYGYMNSIGIAGTCEVIVR
jgi:hypothetical protein